MPQMRFFQYVQTGVLGYRCLFAVSNGNRMVICGLLAVKFFQQLGCFRLLVVFIGG